MAKAEDILKLLEFSLPDGKTIEELELEELKKYSDLFDSDIYDAIELKTLIEARKR